MKWLLAVLMVMAVAFMSSPSLALDKQGSAHDGQIQADDSSFGVSGNLMYGMSLYNPSYAARPGNTGLALFRYAAHVDIDLIGSKLSIPIDLNAFTDGTKNGLRKFVPSEGDVIGGVTTTWNLPVGALELGMRAELDSTLDATHQELNAGYGPNSQGYVDTRSRYLYESGMFHECLTLGWFMFNPTYSARPDLSGIALFRYTNHSELSISKYFTLALDANFFTDKYASDIFQPSELDLTPEVIVNLPPVAIHIAYERDMPVDRGGQVQDYAYALLVWHFSTKSKPVKQFPWDEHHIVSNGK